MKRSLVVAIVVLAMVAGILALAGCPKPPSPVSGPQGRGMVPPPPAKHGEITKPGEMPKPGEMAKPGEVAKPGEMAKPEAMPKPGEMAKPGEAAQPGAKMKTEAKPVAGEAKATTTKP